MKDITADTNLIAYCGLYCGACGSYLKGKCPGCQQNHKASWCGIRLCCTANDYDNCALCLFYNDPAHCKKFNNVISRAIGFFLNSDRKASVVLIKEMGPEGYAKFMAANKTQRIKKRG